MWNDNEETKRGDDWKQWKSGWQYRKDAPTDEQWKKDRQRLFKENGNGWWWFQKKKEGR